MALKKTEPLWGTLVFNPPAGFGSVRRPRSGRRGVSRVDARWSRALPAHCMALASVHQPARVLTFRSPRGQNYHPPRVPDEDAGAQRNKLAQGPGVRSRVNLWFGGERSVRTLGGSWQPREKSPPELVRGPCPQETLPNSSALLLTTWCFDCGFLILCLITDCVHFPLLPCVLWKSLLRVCLYLRSSVPSPHHPVPLLFPPPPFFPFLPEFLEITDSVSHLNFPSLY